MKLVQFKDRILFLDPEVYTPHEDTFFLEDIICSVKNIITNPVNNCLEMGCGSGYLTITLKKVFSTANIYAIDINPDAVKLTLKNMDVNHLTTNIHVIQSNLFDFLTPNNEFKTSFDVIIFNPPYLPSERNEIAQPGITQAWAGGNRTGDKVILDFLHQLLEKRIYLSVNVVIILLLSNWNKCAVEWIQTSKFFKIIDKKEKRYLGETLTIYILGRQQKFNLQEEKSKNNGERDDKS